MNTSSNETIETGENNLVENFINSFTSPKIYNLIKSYDINGKLNSIESSEKSLATRVLKYKKYFKNGLSSLNVINFNHSKIKLETNYDEMNFSASLINKFLTSQGKLINTDEIKLSDLNNSNLSIMEQFKTSKLCDIYKLGSKNYLIIRSYDHEINIFSSYNNLKYLINTSNKFYAQKVSNFFGNKELGEYVKFK